MNNERIVQLLRGGDVLTLENAVPDPKNPIIAGFFREIGYADQLGSGVRNLFKYAKAYGGSNPVFNDGDTFRITVPLEGLGRVDAKFGSVGDKSAEVAQKGAEVAQKLEGKGRADAVKNAVAVFNALQRDGSLSIRALETLTRLSNGSVKNSIRLLRLNGIIGREGPDRGGRWVVLI